MKSRTLILIVILIVSIGLLPRAHATDLDPVLPAGNTADGFEVLINLTSGFGNSAFGHRALKFLTTGNGNAAAGFLALSRDLDGNSNTATGAFCLANNRSGDENTASGYGALFLNDIGGTGNGNRNSAFGNRALLSNTDGSNNSALGSTALASNTSGANNTATGLGALLSNTTGNDNTADGAAALVLNTSGSNNTAVGVQTLGANVSGNNNTVIGAGAGAGVSAANNVICIGYNVQGANVSNSCFIGNIRGVTTGNSDAIPVLIDSIGQLGTASSSRRFKKEIRPMDKASEAILALKPVTFQYKSDKSNTPQFGLVAEDVAWVNPGLVVRDRNGEIYTVRYDAVNAMLLNEFLKEHRKVEEQQATIAQLKENFQSQLAEQQQQIKVLASGLEKVSAQLEVSKPAPQTVLNNQ